MKETPFTDKVLAIREALTDGIPALADGWEITWQMSEYRKEHVEHKYEVVDVKPTMGWVVFEKKHTLGDIYINRMREHELFYLYDEEVNYAWNPTIVKIVNIDGGSRGFRVIRQ